MVPTQGDQVATTGLRLLLHAGRYIGGHRDLNKDLTKASAATNMLARVQEEAQAHIPQIDVVSFHHHLGHSSGTDPSGPGHDYRAAAVPARGPICW